MRLRLGILALVVLGGVPSAARRGPAGRAPAEAAATRTSALASGGTPTTTVSGRNVTVSWAAAGGPVPISGYQVKRYDGTGQSQSIGAACSATIAVLSCTEQAVPAGQWRYTVTPRQQQLARRGERPERGGHRHQPLPHA